MRFGGSLLVLVFTTVAHKNSESQGCFYFEGPKGSVQHFDFKFVSMSMIYNFDL